MEVGGAITGGLTRAHKGEHEILSCRGAAALQLAAYVLNRYSGIPGTQPHEYEYGIPLGYPYI